ncbi:PQQ-dependent sugar dehydrogenase [Luteimonas saliphila]|uniref:PQQ-dependent sugar dehydrogenase n=1 Tax=Luteimonas saliphila TaxID=2804919 RepID=UPI00192DF842|nr:PQQ-dependent sugar dehydrogenase [Luteimonas saliphila]
MPRPALTTTLLSLALLTACNANGTAESAAQSAAKDTAATAQDAGDRQARETREIGPFSVETVAAFDEPWALSFLPDGRLLVSEKPGALRLVDVASGRAGEVTGVPDVVYGGQGGFGDVVPHPEFAENGMVYLSYAEAGDGDTAGAAVARARLVTDDAGGGALENLEVVWRQVPKVSGRGHYAHRIVFHDGMLWIGSGDRQKFDPAQDMASNMGKVLRLNDDGSVPADNPFAGQGEVAAQVWSLGHRNPLGVAFDDNGQLWDIEMGPKGGDELNRVERGANYGYPIVSNGDHYDGRPIPDHDTRPEFNAPAITWTPVISPSSLVFYSGDLFPDWKGDAFAGGLSSQALVRIEFEGDRAWEAERFEMGARIRGVRQGPDGALWVIEDGKGGRLLKLTPKG